MADQVVWTSPTGEVIDLTDHAAGWTVTAEGTRGLTSPTYSIASEAYAGIDGAVVHAIKAEAREFALGLHIRAASDEQLRKRVRALVHAMRPTSGLGTLKVTTPWGDERYIDCYCTGGLEGDEDPGVTQPGRWFRAVVGMYAPDPWWRGEPRVVDVGLGAGEPFFPLFPLQLAPSRVSGEFTIDLTDSDTVSYPTWEIIGPGSGLVLTNLTTGRVIASDAVGLGAAAHRHLHITTQPGAQSIRFGSGENVMYSLKSDPALWPLIAGVNRVHVKLDGATSTSRIIGRFAARYAGV